MSITRVGAILAIVGLLMLLIPNMLLPRVYNTVINVLSNATITLDTYSRFLVPIYLNSPAYVVVILNNSHLLPMYMLDEFGHILMPNKYEYEHGMYLVIFPLIGHGNYSLILINDYPEDVNVSLSITAISNYLVNNILLMNLMMDLGTAILILGAILMVTKYLYRAVRLLLMEIKNL